MDESSARKAPQTAENMDYGTDDNPNHRPNKQPLGQMTK